MYLWEKSDWPTLSWDEKSLTRLLAEVSREQGRLLGKMEALGFELRSEAHLQTLTEDVVKSSEIEGEKLEPRQVRSSIARRLGMDGGGLVPADRNVEGVVEMMLDATSHYAEPLTEKRLVTSGAIRQSQRRCTTGSVRMHRTKTHPVNTDYLTLGKSRQRVV